MRIALGFHYLEFALLFESVGLQLLLKSRRFRHYLATFSAPQSSSLSLRLRRRDSHVPCVLLSVCSSWSEGVSSLDLSSALPAHPVVITCYRSVWQGFYLASTFSSSIVYREHLLSHIKEHETPSLRFSVSPSVSGASVATGQSTLVTVSHSLSGNCLTLASASLIIFSHSSYGSWFM